jgi:transcriptional repressor NrdR
VRFASVYRSFEDVDAFREEVQRLQAEPSSESRRKQLRLLPEDSSGPAAGDEKRPARGRRPLAGRKP